MTDFTLQNYCENTFEPPYFALIRTLYYVVYNLKKQTILLIAAVCIYFYESIFSFVFVINMIK